MKTLLLIIVVLYLTRFCSTSPALATVNPPIVQWYYDHQEAESNKETPKNDNQK